jgi:hypothetical protein
MLAGGITQHAINRVSKFLGADLEVRLMRTVEARTLGGARRECPPEDRVLKTALTVKTNGTAMSYANWKNWRDSKTRNLCKKTKLDVSNRMKM